MDQWPHFNTNGLNLIFDIMLNFQLVSSVGPNGILHMPQVAVVECSYIHGDFNKIFMSTLKWNGYDDDNFFSLWL